MVFNINNNNPIHLDGVLMDWWAIQCVEDYIAQMSVWVMGLQLLLLEMNLYLQKDDEQSLSTTLFVGSSREKRIHIWLAEYEMYTYLYLSLSHCRLEVAFGTVRKMQKRGLHLNGAEICSWTARFVLKFASFLPLKSLNITTITNNNNNNRQQQQK